MCITSKKTKLKFRTRHAKMAASENSRRLLGARAGDARRSLAARRNRMWAPEVCLWLAAMLAGCCALQEQKFAMEPQDQTAILGSRVTLPCRVERKAGALQWTKDDFGLGTHRNLSGYDRYSMVGSDEEGDYSLDIRDVTLEDDASYQCQVSSGPNGEPAIRSRYAQLSVLVAPEPPRIIQGAFIDATEGHPVDIECVSVGGKPAAEITWVDGHQAVIRDGVETKVELMPDGQRFTTRSTLRLTPSMEHHNLTVTCQAQNTADRAYRMAFVHVEVKYAPKLTMSLSSPAVNNMIREGSEARIRCAVAANPPAHSYTWYLDDHPLVGDYTDELIIFNVTKKLNNAEVKCEVGNSVGRSEQSMRLQVTYPPSFRSKPVDVEADPDSWVTLQCDVDAAPAPAVRWLLHEPGRVGQVKGKSATLKLQVSNKTAGRYICKAAVEGYPEIEAEASVLVKGPPSILSNRTQLAEEGETARVECLYLSVPKPDDVSWYFEGREINFIQNPDYTSVDTILDGGLTRAALVIRSSGAQHYGVYNCSVTNEYGNANAAITLKPLKSLPLFIILIGVSSGIIIFALFTTMVAVCHRRRRQAAPGLSKKPDVTVTGTDLFKDSDRSSNISDLKPQLNGDGGYELEYTSSEQSHKMSGGLPLAGPVPVSPRHDDPLLQFRYSNDYTDPQYTDTYYKHGSLGDYLYDYQGYPPPPTLRVQSPPLAEQQTRSQQGSLTRSIDTASTLPLSGGSQSSSLQRGKPDETDAINSLGLPLAGDTPPTPIYAQPQSKHPAHGHGAPPALALSGGVDVRYSAAYGNPYLRNSSLGYGAQAGGKAGAPAPPPYSAVRSSVVIPQGNGTQLSHV